MPLPLRLSLLLLLGCGSPEQKSGNAPVGFDADLPPEDDSETDSGAPEDTGTDIGMEPEIGPAPEIEVPPELDVDGVYEGELTVTLLADPFDSGVLLEEICEGPLQLTVSRTADPSVVGAGDCSIPEGGMVAALLGSTGPFDGTASGSVEDDGAATGTIVLEIEDVLTEIVVDWTGGFEDEDGTLTFSGEYDGAVEGLEVDLGGPVLIFDVSYSGGFTTVRTDPSAVPAAAR